MIPRLDPPQDPDRQPLPPPFAVMRPKRGRLPKTEDGWAFEVRWQGVRGLLRGEGGRVELLDGGDGDDVVPLFPELRALGRTLGAHQVLLDGVLTVPGDDGRPDPDRLAERLAAHGSSDSVVRRLSRQHPGVLMLIDVLHDDGRSYLESPWAERRRRLDGLGLAGAARPTPAAPPRGRAAPLGAGRGPGLSGIVAQAGDRVPPPRAVSAPRGGG